MALLLIAVGLVAVGAWGAPLAAAVARADTAESASAEMSAARSEVVLGTLGIPAQPVRESLVALLHSELRAIRLSLVEDQSAQPVSAWARKSTGSGRVLAVILLDGRSEHGWRLTIIDAARGRAAVRGLPGGIHDDAASIEAVANIVVSAASALREGLEAASTPLGAVLGGSPKPREAASASDTTSSPAKAPAVPASPHWAARGQMGPTLTSFSPAAPTTVGMALALGVSFRAGVEARVFGAAFLPSLIRSPLGEFRVGRTLLGAAAGPVLRAATFSFAPEAGVVGEWLRRYGAEPIAGVFAPESAALSRFGGLFAVRLRHTFLPPLSVELATGAIYFGRRLQFTARSAGSSWSERVWPAVAFGQLGLEIATD
jgi:hypothetical protein